MPLIEFQDNGLLSLESQRILQSKEKFTELFHAFSGRRFELASFFKMTQDEIMVYCIKYGLE